MPITACFISDSHLRDIFLPEADITFHSGDFLMGGTRQEWEQNLKWLERERAKSRHWVITGGNHDKFIQKNEIEARKDLAALDIHLLLDEQICIDGLMIYGTPWVPFISGRWSWEAIRGHNYIRQKWLDIPEGLDVLLTHTAAYGIMDQSIRPSGLLSEHYGCWDLKDIIQTMGNPPKIVAHGHIHRTPEQTRIEDNYGITKWVNAALLDDHYEYVNPPILLEIE